MSVNKVILMGNVGKDPEYKDFDNGGSVAQFTLATTDRAFKTANGTVSIHAPTRGATVCKVTYYKSIN